MMADGQMEKVAGIFIRLQLAVCAVHETQAILGTVCFSLRHPSVEVVDGLEEPGRGSMHVVENV